MNGRRLDCAHIYAASEGNNVRQNDGVAEDFLRSDLNGVYACQNCHDFVYDDYDFHSSGCEMMRDSVIFRVKKILKKNSIDHEKNWGTWFAVFVAHDMVGILNSASLIEIGEIKDDHGAHDAVDQIKRIRNYIISITILFGIGMHHANEMSKMDAYRDKDALAFDLILRKLFWVHGNISDYHYLENYLYDRDWGKIEKIANDIYSYVNNLRDELNLRLGILLKYMQNLVGSEDFALYVGRPPMPLVRLSYVVNNLDDHEVELSLREQYKK